ncbi:MAG: FAD-dependent oxidoreductase [Deltaproteobacteria bacterium]|nr:FAD-dependent oxidoreductase [Deltaproteobacteria bacterium]
MYDFAIIGGGIAGLELGAMLSHDGHSAIVLEQSEHVGGRSFVHVRDGFTLDNGIHLVRFGRKSAVARVLRHIGRTIEFASPGNAYLVDQNDDLVLFPTGPAGFLKSRLFTFSERLKALKVMVRLKSGSYGGLDRYTVEDWMQSEGIEGGLKRYFRLVSASMLVCPITSVASARALIENVNAVLKTGISVEYPLHGWRHDIIDPLIRTIKQHGEIKTGTRVESVVLEDGKATGVRTKDGIVRARDVVIDVPSQEIGKILDVGAVKSDRLRTALGLVPTSGISVDYAVQGKISDIDGLIYFEDPISFGCVISNIAPDTAPAGKSLLTWFCPIHYEEMKQKEQVRNYQQRLEDRIERVFPALKESTIFKRVLHMSTVDGVELNINQLQGKRLDYAIDGIGNLYLVGDTTAAAGAGGDIAHESSIGCYEKITGSTA